MEETITRKVRGISLVALFAALTATGALIAIPLPGGVPFTLQVLFTLLAGLILGPRLGAASQATYALIGVAGLPVFAGGKAGPGVLFGPTGGYVFGFIAAAYTVGLITRDSKSLPRLALAMAAGILIIYGLGVAQLSVVASLDPVQAITVGMLPFLPGDVVKAVVAVFIARTAWPIINQ